MDNDLKIYKGTFFELLIATVSALSLSIISAINSAKSVSSIAVYFIIFSFFFLILFLITIGCLSVINSHVKSRYGKGFVYGSVIHGFMLLFPFAVILFVSDVLLKWNAFQTITATSIITSISYSVSDLMKLGGHRIGNIVISLILGVVFMLLFLLISSIKIIN